MYLVKTHEHEWVDLEKAWKIEIVEGKQFMNGRDFHIVARLYRPIVFGANGTIIGSFTTHQKAIMVLNKLLSKLNITVEGVEK